jgi:hypothetical protein
MAKRAKSDSPEERIAKLTNELNRLQGGTAITVVIHLPEPDHVTAADHVGCGPACKTITFTPPPKRKLT